MSGPPRPSTVCCGADVQILDVETREVPVCQYSPTSGVTETEIEARFGRGRCTGCGRELVTNSHPEKPWSAWLPASEPRSSMEG